MNKVLTLLAQVFLISLPQNIAIMIGIYAFNKQKIQSRPFWLCTIVSLPVIFLIRMLPIRLGIHTLLCMIVLIFLSVYILRFSIQKTIKSVFFTFFVILVPEIINMMILKLIFGAKTFDAFMAVPLTNAIAGFPASLIIFAAIIVIYIISMKKTKKETENGKTADSVS